MAWTSHICPRFITQCISTWCCIESNWHPWKYIIVFFFMTLSKESPCKEHLVKWHHVIYSSITSLQDCYAFNKLLTQITIKQKSMCNGNHIWLLSAHKPIAWEASVHRKERCFNQKSRQPGGEGGLMFWDQLPWLFSALTFFKGKRRGNNLSESSRQEVGFCIFLHCVQTGWLSSDVFLSHVISWRIA